MLWYRRSWAVESLPRSCSTRMYTRLNNDVVNPTSAVSATRNTLKASTRNSSCISVIGPSAMVRAVSAAADSSVSRLIDAFISAAQERLPHTASSSAPSSGKPSTRAMSIMEGSFVLELLQMMNVETVEGLANLEEKDAEDERADQNIETDAELHHHRHAVGGAGGREEQAVLHCQKADYLRHGLAPRNHHQEREQHARHRDAQAAARDGACQMRDRDRKSTRLNSSHMSISYAVFCLKKKKNNHSMHWNWPGVGRESV